NVYGRRTSCAVSDRIAGARRSGRSCSPAAARTQEHRNYCREKKSELTHCNLDFGGSMRSCRQRFAVRRGLYQSLGCALRRNSSGLLHSFQNLAIAGVHLECLTTTHRQPARAWFANRIGESTIAPPPIKFSMKV